MKKVLAGGAVLVAASDWSATASAANGQMVLRASKTLNADQYGAIIFAVDDITLDCAGHAVRYSPTYTRLNCAPEGPDRKCGIIAAGRQRITIKNCVVSGGFDFAVDLENTKLAKVQNTTVTGSAVGFKFLLNDSVYGGNLTADAVGLGMSVTYDSYGLFENTTISSTELWGVYMDHSLETAFDVATISGAGQYGFTSAWNTGVSLNALNITHSRFGLVTFDSPGMLSNSYIAENDNEGLYVSDSNDGVFIGNAVVNNTLVGGQCDAFERYSTGNYYSNNTFSSWCGSMPDNH